MADSLKSLESENEELKKKVKDLTRHNNRQFMGKYDEGKVIKDIKSMTDENEKLRSAVRELHSEYNYGKQRENKLMYLVYLLH